jgi:hypothetical protein
MTKIADPHPDPHQNFIDPEHWFGNALTWQAEGAGLALEEAGIAALVAARVHQSSSLALVERDAAARAHATAICKEKFQTKI